MNESNSVPITKIEIDQSDELNLISTQTENFGYRYAFARSADTKKKSLVGQDYLSIWSNRSRWAFAVCDGVSQSFFGNLAAQRLGNSLVEWLWKQTLESTEVEEGQSLNQLLTALISVATNEVNVYQLDPNLFPLQKEALEMTRVTGSQSTFVCGLVDTSKDSLLLAWMGDTRIRVFGKFESKDDLGFQFLTSERWSSKEGPVGTLHYKKITLSLVEELLVYSDGLSVLNDQDHQQILHQSIQELINNLQFTPTSDDITFLNFWVGPSAPIQQEEPVIDLVPVKTLPSQPVSEPMPRGEMVGMPIPQTEPLVLLEPAAILPNQSATETIVIEGSSEVQQPDKGAILPTEAPQPFPSLRWWRNRLFKLMGIVLIIILFAAGSFFLVTTLKSILRPLSQSAIHSSLTHVPTFGVSTTLTSASPEKTKVSANPPAVLTSPTTNSTSVACLLLISPQENAKVPSSGPMIFSWTSQPDAVRYIIQFKQTNGYPFTLAVLTNKKTQYLESLGNPGVYFWQVTAYDQSNHAICTSSVSKFTK